MTPNQYIVVRLTPDQKNIAWWVVDDKPMRRMPLRAEPNLTTSSSTMGTAVAAEMPTLST